MEGRDDGHELDIVHGGYVERVPEVGERRRSTSRAVAVGERGKHAEGRGGLDVDAAAWDDEGARLEDWDEGGEKLWGSRVQVLDDQPRPVLQTPGERAWLPDKLARSGAADVAAEERLGVGLIGNVEADNGGDAQQIAQVRDERGFPTPGRPAEEAGDGERGGAGQSTEVLDRGWGGDECGCVVGRVGRGFGEEDATHVGDVCLGQVVLGDHPAWAVVIIIRGWRCCCGWRDEKERGVGREEGREVGLRGWGGGREGRKRVVEGLVLVEREVDEERDYGEGVVGDCGREEVWG